ncbi:tat pathway signal sequence [Trichoderma gracile]
MGRWSFARQASLQPAKFSEDQLSQEALLNDTDTVQRLKKRWASGDSMAVACAICLVSLTFLSVIQVINSMSCACRSASRVHSPANSAIQYHRLTFDNDLESTSPFVGEPRDELHKAWAGLLKNGNTRVSAADLAKINRTSVPLNDEQGGFLVTLDVYHELHCLNILREQIYREHYPDKHDHRTQFQHVDHCIDLLRQVLMCHGDVSMSTFDWIDNYRWPWPNFTVQHECRKWDVLDEWAEKHAVKDMYGPILTHPVLGTI